MPLAVAKQLRLDQALWEAVGEQRFVRGDQFVGLTLIDSRPYHRQDVHGDSILRKTGVDTLGT